MALAPDVQGALQGRWPNERLPAVPALDAQREGQEAGVAGQIQRLERQLNDLQLLYQSSSSSSSSSSQRPTLSEGNPFAEGGEFDGVFGAGFVSGGAAWEQQGVRYNIYGGRETPHMAVMKKYFELILKYFGEAQQHEADLFLLEEMGKGTGVRPDETHLDFGRRLQCKLESLKGSSGVVPLQPGVEVEVYLKGISGNAECRAAVENITPQLNQLGQQDFTLNRVMQMVENALKGQRRLRTWEQQVASARQRVEPGGSSGSSSRGKQQDQGSQGVLDLSHMTTRQIQKALQRDPAAHKKVLEALQVHQQQPPPQQPQYQWQHGQQAVGASVPMAAAAQHAPGAGFGRGMGPAGALGRGGGAFGAGRGAPVGGRGAAVGGRGAPGGGRGAGPPGGGDRRVHFFRPCDCRLQGHHGGVCWVSNPSSAPNSWTGPRDLADKQRWLQHRAQDGLGPPPVAAAVVPGGYGMQQEEPLMFNALSVAVVDQEPGLREAWRGDWNVEQLEPVEPWQPVVAATTRAGAASAATKGGAAAGASGQEPGFRREACGLLGRAFLRPGRDRDLVDVLVERRKGSGAAREAVSAAAAHQLRSFTVPDTAAERQQAMLGSAEPPAVLLAVELFLPADQDVLAELLRRNGMEARARAAWQREQEAEVAAVSAVPAEVAASAARRGEQEAEVAAVSAAELRALEPQVSLADIVRFRECLEKLERDQAAAEQAVAEQPGASSTGQQGSSCAEFVAAAQAAAAEAADAAEICASAAKEAAAAAAAAVAAAAAPGGAAVLVGAPAAGTAPAAAASVAKGVAGATTNAAPDISGDEGYATEQQWRQWQESEGTLAFFANRSAEEGLLIKLPCGRRILAGMLMLDSGSEVNLMTSEFAAAARIPTYRLATPLKMRNADGVVYSAQYSTGPVQLVLADGTRDRTAVEVEFTVLDPGSGADRIYQGLISTKWSHEAAGRGLDQALQRFWWSPDFREHRSLRKAWVPMRCYMEPGARKCTGLQLVTAGVAEEQQGGAAAVQQQAVPEAGPGESAALAAAVEQEQEVAAAATAMVRDAAAVMEGATAAGGTAAAAKQDGAWQLSAGLLQLGWGLLGLAAGLGGGAGWLVFLGWWLWFGGGGWWLQPLGAAALLKGVACLLWQQLGHVVSLLLWPQAVAAALHGRLAAILWSSWAITSRQQRRRWEKGRLKGGPYRGMPARQFLFSVVLWLLLSMAWCCSATRGLDSLGMEYSLLVTAGLALWKARCPRGTAGCFLGRARARAGDQPPLTGA